MPNAPAESGLDCDLLVFDLDCDLLVFDLDGTLVDSEVDLANAVNAVLDSLGRQPLPQRQVVGFIGEGAATLVNRALDATGGRTQELAEDALHRFIVHYRHHLLDNTRPYEGVLQALKDIRAAAPLLPMAVLTNKPVNPSRAICDGLELSRFFFANYGGNSFVTKKPDPLGLLTLMEEAGRLRRTPVQPVRTVMIGDSHVDVETARAAGARSLGCLYGLSPESLLASEPDAVAHTPVDWLPQIRQLMQSSMQTQAATQEGAASHH